jgi:alpha-N-arabinofuranosidase
MMMQYSMRHLPVGLAPSGCRHAFTRRCANLSLALAVCLSLSTRAKAQSPIRIEVHADQKASYNIPRTIFGTFLEPIGNSTYNGLWAEILQNPSLEENLWNASNIARMVEEQPSLAQASHLGLPLPWEPLDFKQGNRYEPRWGDAANSWRSLAVFGVPGSETGIRQQVFLPVHRELRYHGSLYAKHLSGAGGLEISLRRRNDSGTVFATAKIPSLSPEWHKYMFDLSLSPGQVHTLEPADFVIKVESNEDVQLDQVSLMPADAIDGLDPDMVRMAKEMHTPLLRFGGNFTSAYHWRDGVGPLDKRVSMLNVAWGIPEYNTFGTDEFLRFCRLIDAQPQIALNLGSGAPEEAADWVRYVVQHWGKHSGLLWELGNELWGNWNLGSPTLDQVAERTRKFSEAVRNADPNARLIATGQDPDVYKTWNARQLTNPAGTFDFLSTHFVVTTDRTETQNPSPDFLAKAAFALPVELGRRLEAMQGQIDQSPRFKGKAHLAFTEWLYVGARGRTADSPRYDNMGGAIGAAGILNMLIQHANIVPISDMTGIIEFAGIWKKRSRVYAAPAYYALRLYSSADVTTPVSVQNDSPVYDIHKGITRLPEIPGVPYLEVVAALNKAGDRLTLFCINRHLTRDFPVAISIDGFKPSGNATVDSLFSNSIYDTNDEVNPEAIKPITKSLSVNGPDLQFTFRHESITRIELRSRN